PCCTGWHLKAGHMHRDAPQTTHLTTPVSVHQSAAKPTMQSSCRSSEPAVRLIVRNRGKAGPVPSDHLSGWLRHLENNSGNCIPYYPAALPLNGRKHHVCAVTECENPPDSSSVGRRYGIPLCLWRIERR